MGIYILKEYITEIMQVAVSIGVGGVAGFFAVYVFNHCPLKWIWKDEEEPMPDIQGKRIKEMPWMIVFAVFFMLVTFRLMTVYLAPYTPLDYLQMMLHIVVIWIMIQIGIFAKQYNLIPDQYILIIVVIGLFLEQSILGAVLGATVFILIGLLGRFILKKNDLMDYENIKLTAAIGFAVGTGYLMLILLGAALVTAIVLISTYLRKKTFRPEIQPISHYMMFFAIIIMLS